MSAPSKPLVATTSLAGCFGCHMSLLDIDERILQLIELVEFHKSPIDDRKDLRGFVWVDIGISG
jgi:NAD-reducing hydrogenase small subunit